MRQLPPHAVVVPASRRVLRATSARSATRRIEPSSSLTNAVPRSKLKVTMATRQPSFSSPTRFSTGMRTSSRNISLNSLTPVSVFIGRTLDARRVHRHDQPRDALVLRRVGVGADEQLAVVGHLGVRGPDLLAAHDVVVAVAHRLRAQRREVGPGAGLGEALAPHVVALEDAAGGSGPSARACPRRRSSARRGGCRRSCSRRTGAPAFSVSSRKIELLGGRGAPAAELLRPGDARRSRRRRGAAASRCRRPAWPSSRRAAAPAAPWAASPRATARSSARNAISSGVSSASRAAPLQDGLQLGLEHLAHLVAGQRVDRLEPHRHLVRREVRTAVI